MMTPTKAGAAVAGHAPNTEMGLVPVGNRAIAAPRAEVSSPVPTGHRRHKRARAEELLVKVRVGDGMLVARVEDISIGGLFARTQKIIPVGAFVEMGLLRPGHEELSLTGVVVADTGKRAGLAVKFENLGPPAHAELRRVVLDQQVKSANDAADVEPTRGMRPAQLDAPSPARDRELEELRRRVALLSAENEQLRADVEAAARSQQMVGRALEIEHLRSRSSIGGGVVDADLLATIKRDCELAWTAIARLSDSCEKIR